MKDVDNNPGSVQISEDTLRQWVHSLQGPVTNVKAFGEELSTALDGIREIAGPVLKACADEDRKSFEQLMSEDVEPCLRLLTQSVVQLQERADEISSDIRRSLLSGGKPV